MSTGDYLPKADSDLLVWLNNFQSKFGTYAPTLGFTPAEVTGVTDDYNMLAFAVHAAEVLRNQSQAHTSFKNTLIDGPIGAAQPAVPSIPPLPVPATMVQAGIAPRMRAMVQIIKARANYTESLGTDLGIIASASAAAPPSKPTATATAEPGSAVRIDWVKAGFDGVIVEGQRGQETVWTSLGTDLRSPYDDTRAPLQLGVPEPRRYRLRYLKGDTPTGDYTDTINLITTP